MLLWLLSPCYSKSVIQDNLKCFPEDTHSSLFCLIKKRKTRNKECSYYCRSFKCWLHTTMSDCVLHASNSILFAVNWQRFQLQRKMVINYKLRTSMSSILRQSTVVLRLASASSPWCETRVKGMSRVRQCVRVYMCVYVYLYQTSISK